MSILDLPIEILAIITTADLYTFLAALKAPGIGPRLCCEYVQNYAKSVFTTICNYPDGIVYCLCGRIHRDDGPAVECTDGYMAYYRYGKRHREDGPARIYPGNRVEYYLNDKLHRSDGPAIVYDNGRSLYFRHGRLL
jgi:hypothetical protein